MPIGYGRTYYDSRVKWKYSTEPVAEFSQSRLRRDACPHIREK